MSVYLMSVDSLSINVLMSMAVTGHKPKHHHLKLFTLIFSKDEITVKAINKLGLL
jgi:hypothetical protein